MTGEPIKIDEAEAIKREREEAAERAVREFARSTSSRLTLSKPNENLNPETSAFSRYTKEQIMSFMQNPAANVKQLRDASNYMADVSTQYNRLLEHYANLYIWAYTVSPVSYNGALHKAAKKAYWDSLALLERLNISHTAPIVFKTALREGVFYGTVWQGSNVLYVQRIPPEYCKLTHILDGTWQYSVDMSKIKENRLDFYPAEFKSMWQAYQAGKGKWQEVPSKISFCLKADESVTNYCIPPFAATLGLLYDIEQYKALQETGAAINNYKLLNMKIPLNTDGTPQVDWPLADKYYRQLCNNIPQYIGVSISPMDLKDYDFEHSSTTDQVDIVARAEDTYWASNGTSALLHGSKSGTTAGVLRLSIKSDEAFIKPMVRQLELLVNRILREQISAEQKYRINILPVTIYNQEEMLKYYKEAATLGIPGAKSAYASVLGTQAYDVLGINTAEIELLQMDELIPLKSTYTMSSDQSSSSDAQSEVGRPAQAEENLTESGETTRETSANDNR